MAEADSDAKQTEKKVSDLAAAIDRVREAQTDRDDVVVEMRQAARARLEMLARDLQPVFEDLPEGNDQFEFSLTSGDDPRLWVDMTSFVRMGRDRRFYQFVKDTRLGRVTLAETDSRGDMARSITDYVAERVLERERAIEGDWLAMKHHDFASNKPVGDGPTGGKPSELTAKPATAKRENSGAAGKTFAIFLLGLIIGAGVVITLLQNGALPTL